MRRGKQKADFTLDQSTPEILDSTPCDAGLSKRLVQGADGNWGILVWKRARRLGDDRWTGIGVGGPYGLEATAQCGRQHCQSSPTPDCTCGFYALTHRGRVPGSERKHSLLQVVLTGRVLVYGWREAPASWTQADDREAEPARDIDGVWLVIGQHQRIVAEGIRKTPGGPYSWTRFTHAGTSPDDEDGSAGQSAHRPGSPASPSGMLAMNLGGTGLEKVETDWGPELELPDINAWRAARRARKGQPQHERLH